MDSSQLEADAARARAYLAKHPPPPDEPERRAAAAARRRAEAEWARAVQAAEAAKRVQARRDQHADAWARDAGDPTAAPYDPWRIRARRDDQPHQP